MVYNSKPTRLNRENVSLVFRMAILDCRFHPGRGLVEMTKVYEKNEVELLFYPDLVMTYQDLEGVCQTLRVYLHRVTTFSIFDKQWRQLGSGKLGLV